MKIKSVIKWFAIVLVSIVVLLFGFGFWFMNLIPSGINRDDLEATKPENISYLSENTIAHRGKVLAVVTSMDVMGSTGKRTGYELTELARAYYVFQANGFEVDVASPLGGKPSAIIDDDDMGAIDFAFMNDTIAQYKINHTIPIDHVNANEYQAIFFAGGKGAMFDFPQNTTIQAIIRDYYQSGKVIGAVCHGPAALVNVTLDDGVMLLKDKQVSSFTNEEELLLIPEAEAIFPFLLQDKLVAQGANFSQGNMYLEKVSQDRNLVTGQNPWSTWAVAEMMIQQMGYVPKKREITPEENSVKILSVYQEQGYAEAKETIKKMVSDQQIPISRSLLAAHSIVAAMQKKVSVSYDLVNLLAFAKSQSKVK